MGKYIGKIKIFDGCAVVFQSELINTPSFQDYLFDWSLAFDSPSFESLHNFSIRKLNQSFVLSLIIASYFYVFSRKNPEPFLVMVSSSRLLFMLNNFLGAL